MHLEQLALTSWPRLDFYGGSSRPSAYSQLRCSGQSPVAVCGLMLGYFVFRTFVSPLPRQYQLTLRGPMD